MTAVVPKFEVSVVEDDRDDNCPKVMTDDTPNDAESVQRDTQTPFIVSLPSEEGSVVFGF